MRRWNRFAALCLPLLHLAAAAAFAQSPPAAPASNQPISVTAPGEQDEATEPVETAPPAEGPSAFESQPLGGAPTERKFQQAEVDTNPGNWWLQTTLALGVVIALIFALRWLLQRMSGAGAVGSGGGLVEVLARAPIGHKTQIVFLRVSERIIVAGQTPAGLNTLAEFEHPDDVASVLQAVESSRPNSISRSFASLLGQADRATETGYDDSEHLVDRTRDGLSGLANRIRSMRGGDGE